MHKKNRHLISAVVKGILLGVEEYIKDVLYYKGYTGLEKFLEKNKDRESVLETLRNKIDNNCENDVFLRKIKELIVKEKDSLEKYLMIYYHSRNYVAHNNIDIEKFFYGEDNDYIIINGVIDAVIMIIYLLNKVSVDE